ncbi:transcription factor Pcc1 [Saitoella complicata NRRL Y-17804]|uniref:transcription factor Pcc1 n=1 Tax=Saitoella complicata (strain BCRC 22490 / CBS 7301 / JCM 7358 / NBRC 10748 / NRRL Y-17804) TaxID=698492 RepID=UPI0008672BE6|nr:transcription factor Pcc1 [Saitoella complicata NRRL Y-17804]ODQ50075.1 transcription factor Pcc1 [Saitoella complicata NRRL Y-17804]
MAPSAKVLDHVVTLQIPFPTPQLAAHAKRILDVDEEIKPDQVRRSTRVQEGQSVLEATFECDSSRMARVSVNAFLEAVGVVVEVMGEFVGEE